jgi:hypothetical protein
MFICVEAGCQDVPEPIPPIGSKLFSLVPTRMNISSSFITMRSVELFAIVPIAFPDACVCPAIPGIVCGLELGVGEGLDVAAGACA